MQNLMTLDAVCLAYGLHPLLDHAKLHILSGERICLIGRNGAGKSSLLKIIEGTLLPDSGSVWRRPQLRIARLEQELPHLSTKTVYEFVAEGFAEAGELLAAWYQAIHTLSSDPSSAELAQLQALQQKMDAQQAWQCEQAIKTILLRLALEPERKVAELSGGWQRRAALARALVTSPELLLLDEPTNHLDIEAIQWLENYLLESNVGLVFITHDRALLQRLATRIIEIDRGQLTSWSCDYPTFLLRKAEVLHAEEKMHALFDKKLAQEEKWIRQGIRARRTRNEGRVRALEAMRRERSQRIEKEGKVSFSVSDAKRSGQLVLAAEHISQQYHGQAVIHDFSLRVMRGDRIGLVGPNGVGKSTLLTILLGHVAPQQGTVMHGTNLEIAWFDQRRSALDLEKTVAETISQGGDTIEIDGNRRHVISYLGDFLFTPQRAMTPVKNLSGGECNRLLLARLFSRPANLLVLDEPTNDLDIETLELLEDILEKYRGTLLLVSHDRAFLDNVVTSTLFFAGNGRIEEYVGGYQDLVRQRERVMVNTDIATKKIVKEIAKEVPKETTKKNMLSREDKKIMQQEKEELKKLPQKIQKLESEIALQEKLMTAADFYTQPSGKIKEATNHLDQLNAALAAAWQRWTELEEKWQP